MLLAVAAGPLTVAVAQIVTVTQVVAVCTTGVEEVVVEPGNEVVAIVGIIPTPLPPVEPRAEATLSRKPALAQTWLMSHIMTPPKLEKVWAYLITLASWLPAMYPVPAADELPGTPRRIFTSLFLLTVLAQLSQVPKLKLF